MGNKFTTPGGFKPTPSTCYPWPPWGPQSWPIPCIQGPIPSLVLFQGKFEMLNTVHVDEIPIVLSVVGIAQIGQLTAGHTLTASCPNTTILTHLAAILCNDAGPGEPYWIFGTQFTWLEPGGNVSSWEIPFYTGAVDDFSIPDNYNDIQSRDQPQPTSPTDYLCDHHVSQFYTTGAPIAQLF